MKIALTLNEQICKTFYLKHLDLNLLFESNISPEILKEFDVEGFLDDDQILLFQAAGKFDEDILIPKGVHVHIRRQPRYMPVKNHSHDFIEFVYVYQGGCDHYINGQKHPMNEGSLCLLAPDTFHHISTYDDDSIVFYIMARKSTFDTVFLSLISHKDPLSSFFTHIIYGESKTSYIQFKTESDRVLRRWVFQMYQDSLHEDDYSARMLNVQFEWLCVYLLQHHISNFEFSDSNDSSIDIVPILNYITDHYKTVTIPEMCTHFNYSSGHLQRIIKRSTGRTFNEMVTDMRMKKACELLKNSNLTIQDITASVGIHDMSNFHKMFKKRFHVTPSNYRKYFQ